MMAWVYLIGAILAEVTGTIALRAAVTGHRGWYVLVVAGYGLAFSLLSATLAQGMGIGMAYGIWVAIGVVLTAVAGKVFYGDPFTWLMAAGIVLIMGGVLLIELGAH